MPIKRQLDGIRIQMNAVFNLSTSTRSLLGDSVKSLDR